MENTKIKTGYGVLSFEFILLYFLNCTDIIFTYSFLKTGYFYEANPIMRPIVTNPYLCILTKVLMPFFMIIFLYKHIVNEGHYLLRFCQIATAFLTLIYAAINVLHLYYFFAFIH